MFLTARRKSDKNDEKMYSVTHHEQAMKAPSRVRQFFKTVLQQVHHFKVDVIAGDANAAAYKYFRKQQYQDLYNSSVAVLLREMQREVNEGRPLESRLHIDSYTNNHFSQLSSASALDCCFMAILSCGKPRGPRIMFCFQSARSTALMQPRGCQGLCTKRCEA